jgi:hypothetical protein
MPPQSNKRFVPHPKVAGLATVVSRGKIVYFGRVGRGKDRRYCGSVRTSSPPARRCASCRQRTKAVRQISAKLAEARDLMHAA